MKILKYILLEILLLITMLIISTGVMKILDLIFKLNYENIWNIGFKVGFIAWLILLIISIIKKYKK